MLLSPYTSQKMKFSIKDFLSKGDQIPRKLQIWSHLLKKSLMENFIFCLVLSKKIIPSKFLVAKIMKVGKYVLAWLNGFKLLINSFKVPNK